MEFCRECNSLVDREQQCTNCCTNQLSPDMDIFLTVLELMSEKVKVYVDAMQNRMIMVREDIVASVLEETAELQRNMVRGIYSMNRMIEYIESCEQFPRSEEDLMLIQTVHDPEESAKLFGTELLQFNLDAEDLQEGFSRALNGECVLFRELLKRRDRE